MPRRHFLSNHGIAPLQKDSREPVPITPQGKSPSSQKSFLRKSFCDFISSLYTIVSREAVTNFLALALPAQGRVPSEARQEGQPKENPSAPMGRTSPNKVRGGKKSVPPFAIIARKKASLVMPFVKISDTRRGLGDARKTSPAVTVFDGYVKNRSSRRAHAILWRCAYRAVHPSAVCLYLLLTQLGVKRASCEQHGVLFAHAELRNRLFQRRFRDRRQRTTLALPRKSECGRTKIGRAHV